MQLNNITSVTLANLLQNRKIDFKTDDTSQKYFISRSIGKLVEVKGAITNLDAGDLQFFNVSLSDNIQRTKAYQVSYDYILGSGLTKQGGVFYGGLFGKNNKERDQKVQNVVTVVLSALHNSGKVDLAKDNESIIYFIARSIEKLVEEKGVITNLEAGDLQFFNVSLPDNVQRTKIFDDSVAIISSKVAFFGYLKTQARKDFASEVTKGVLLKDASLVSGDQNTAYIMKTCTNAYFNSPKPSFDVMNKENSIITNQISTCIESKKNIDNNAVIPMSEAPVVGDSSLLEDL